MTLLRNSIADISNEDHVWIIHGFNKVPGQRSVHSQEIRNILQAYLPKDSPVITKTSPLKNPIIESIDGKEIHISLSHSEKILLLAISTEPIGIDVEFLKPRQFSPQIARRYFSKQPADMDEFYREWTAREAFVKALGVGIDASFKTIRTEGEEIKRIGFGQESVLRHVHHVDFFFPEENYMAAICRKNDRLLNFLRN